MPCLHGGTWNGKACECPPGFGGDKCQNKPGTPICQNGGSWDGIKCVCTNLYYGPKCEEVVSSIEIDPPPENVSAKMELTVTVTNQKFTEELQNRTSPLFQEFNKNFTKEMDKIYAGIPEYEGVNITNLSPGSVVVEHEVILRTKFSPEYKELFNTVIQKVEEKIMNATQEQILRNETCTSLLCFNVSATKVQNISVTYNPEEECRKKVGENFAEHFFVEYKDNKPNCITRCTAGFNASMNCNFGKCKLELSGPRCYCLTTDTEWYSGETCEYSTKKSLVYGLLGAVGAVVLVVLIILLVFTFRSKREIKREKYKVTQLYKWHEEDGGPAPEAFQNTGFNISEEQEDSTQLDSIYSNFQPSLDHIDSNTKIKIQRPQVMMTSF